MMRVFKFVVLTLLCFGFAGSPASAASFTFATLPGAHEPANGLPVDAITTITTGAGTVQISLTNLLANPTSVAQVLTDVSFTLNGGNTLGTQVTSSSGQEIDVNANGTVTFLGATSTGWNLDLTGAGANGGTIHLCDIGPSPCGGGAGPAHGIIGPPNGSGIYSAANGSIANNAPHNPFLNGTALWMLSVPGVTASTSVTGVVFSFNTTAGDNVPGVPNIPLTSVPEPGSLVLLSSGFAYLSSRLRRRG